MSGMQGMGPMMRNLRTDRSILERKLSRDTVRRIFAFARPLRPLITAFLVLTVIDACLVVVSPLLVQRIVDHGILQKDTGLVVRIALIMAGVALVSAVLSVAGGVLSSRIGEGLIF